MASRYSETVTDHFAHPRNLGRLPDANGRGVVGDLGHTPVRIEIAVRVEHGSIAAVRFRTFGCAAAIAASSMVTQLAFNRPIAYVKSLTPDDVSAALDGLPSDRMYASRLALNAIHAALEDFESTPPGAL